jgi:hypothetical protein
MTKIHIPNLHRFQNRHGKWQCYYRVSRRTKIRLRAEYLSPEFWVEYNAARAATAPLDVTSRIKAGSFNAAISGYLASKSFADLGEQSVHAPPHSEALGGRVRRRVGCRAATEASPQDARSEDTRGGA